MEKRIALRISDSQLQELKQIANAENRSISALIRIILNEYIQRNTSKQ